ncbi:MAG TPA: LD-carboxypeptidase [Cytophagaceae bacterium]|jgi:muramoyltetrapeptide carboxypeptidase|nr:LD-carboxypeptidase [Cytophagaceae bacterium]
MLKRPAFLKENDQVAVIATAKNFSAEQLETGLAMLEEWRLKVCPGKNLYKEDHQFAGTDKERLKDLQHALDDKNIRAIFCVRGGYGTNRIIDQVDMRQFRQSPKWLAGFSDVTVLHCLLQREGFQSIHGTMPILFGRDSPASLESLRKTLFGEEIQYEIKTDPLNKKGKCEGILIGGNLSILQSMIGTKTDFDSRKKILFIEEIDEYLYHIDRMMIHLKRAGKLKDLSGLVVGHLTDMKDNEAAFGKNVKEIILESVKDYKFPVCFNFPSGHEKENMALRFGAKVRLHIGREKSLLSF